MGQNKVGSFPTRYIYIPIHVACRTKGCAETGYEARLTSGDSSWVTYLCSDEE